jgi:hypothetical protein
MISLTAPGQLLPALPGSPTLAAAQQFTVLAEIAGLLRGENDAAVGSGVRHIFADRPLPGLTCALGPGSSGEDAARLIGGMMVSMPVPFTAVVAALTRERPRMDPVPGGQGHRHLGTDDGDRELAAALGLAPGARVWSRAARMLAGDVTAADTDMTLNQGMIPPALMAMIEAGLPVGTALPDMRRMLPAVTVAWPGDPGLVLSAVLALGGRPAGVTAERVPAAFLDRLAKGAAG